MDAKKIFKSKVFAAVLTTLGVIIVLLLVFKTGEFVAFHKARFSYDWGKNYHQNFGGPERGPQGGFLKEPFNERDFIGGHGTFGLIIKIDNNTIIIKENGNTEKTILISDKTTITDRRENISLSDLKVDDQVTIIGMPNDQGQIEAKFIRIFKKQRNSQ